VHHTLSWVPVSEEEVNIINEKEILFFTFAAFSPNIGSNVDSFYAYAFIFMCLCATVFN